MHVQRLLLLLNILPDYMFFQTIKLLQKNTQYVNKTCYTELNSTLFFITHNVTEIWQKQRVPYNFSQNCKHLLMVWTLNLRL